MFKGLINWWKNISKIVPVKATKDMTNEECMEEYKQLWDSYAVFETFMTQTELNRLNILADTLKTRGYTIYSSVVGVRFEKNK